MYGCVRVCLQPRGTDPTKAPDRHWVNEKDLAEDDGAIPSTPEILGQEVVDPITSFKGTAVARSEYPHAAARIAVQPKALDRDGKPVEAQDFDEPQLVFAHVKKPKQDRPAGPGDMAPRLPSAPRF